MFNQFRRHWAIIHPFQNEFDRQKSNSCPRAGRGWGMKAVRVRPFAILILYNLCGLSVGGSKTITNTTTTTSSIYKSMQCFLCYSTKFCRPNPEEHVALIQSTAIPAYTRIHKYSCIYTHDIAGNDVTAIMSKSSVEHNSEGMINKEKEDPTTPGFIHDLLRDAGPLAKQPIAS